MIRSMTGFGRAQAKLDNGKIAVELKSVNHKFFDVTLKLPEGVMPFEDKIKEILQRKVRRGKINLTLSYDGTIQRDERLNINKKLAKSYYEEFLSLKKELGLKEDMGIRDIITLPGVINYNFSERVYSQLWPRIREAVEAAVGKLVMDREKEGKSIFIDMNKRAKHIEKMLAVIKSRAYLNIEEYRKKFSEKIKDLTNGREIDMGRLEMEVAIYAKNSDISEEITRLKNHIVNFRNTVSGNGEVGKKLDFIAQEMHREINTIGSKAGDFKISKNVIETKSEVEKIREQVKNLE